MTSHDGLTFALAGAGSRGRMFAEWLRDNVAPGSLIAVAEPDVNRRDSIAKMHSIPAEMQFAGWKDLLAKPKLADVLINTTMDADHLGSAVTAMQSGYHMLLEKPMATTLADCAEIESVRAQTKRIVSVCHSLRYHAVYSEVRRLLRAGAIGDIVSFDQLEAVEYIHQSHSFVRGNWGNEGRSTYMLLAKSCHDIDIIADLIDQPCKSVSSYGSLTYFKPEHKPAGATKRCTDGCPAEAACPFSAIKVYGDGKGWANHAGLGGLTRNEIMEALKTSPYGKCAFQTDNDAVDHQVVAMEFDTGITATFTMTAFTPWGGRYVRIHGTKGYLEARVDQRTIDLWEFWANNRHTKVDVPERSGGHGGADSDVISSLIAAVKMEDPASVLTTTTESLRTFTIVEAAERSRRQGRRIEISELTAELERVLA